MATKGKEAHVGKERRGISPSPRKSTGISKLAPPTKVTDSKTNGRNVPNYLKPTHTSNIDPSSSSSKQPPVAKKTSPSDRRKSLDRPLPAAAASSSQVQKTRISPAPKERNIRSSYYTPRRSAIPLKPPSKVLKDSGKDQSRPSRPVGVRKSNSMNGKKQEIEGSASSKAVTRTRKIATIEVTTPPVADFTMPEPQEDLGASLTEDDEAMLNVGNDSTAVPDELTAGFENQGHVSPTEAEHKGDEINEPQIVETSLVTKHQDDETANDNIEEPEDKQQDGEKTSTYEQLEKNGEIQRGSSEQSRNNLDSNFHSEEEVEQQGPSGEVENMEDGGASEASNDQMSEEEEVNIDKSKAIDSPKQEEVSNDTVKSKFIDSPQKESADVAQELKKDIDKTPTTPEVVQGKKDAAVVSNDVIEETATKLREQRKNKVKALAGAFETVISLQESK